MQAIGGEESFGDFGANRVFGIYPTLFVDVVELREKFKSAIGFLVHDLVRLY